VGYGFYRLRLRQVALSAALRQREAELRQQEAEFQQRLTQAQLAALRAQVNPHFIFNVLNSINYFIQQNEIDTASNYLTKFARLIRLILDHSQAEWITLADELEANRLYLSIEALRFNGQFHYTIHLEEGLSAATIQVPPLLLQPYLENAIWHGLMQKESTNRHLELRVALLRADLLQITIEDNGIGREQARVLKSKSAVAHKSRGMGIMAERLDLSRQLSGRAMSVMVEDLYSPQQEPNGTKVMLNIQI
jgi:LytS/YehU family sensor histidine kinase